MKTTQVSKKEKSKNKAYQNYSELLQNLKNTKNNSSYKSKEMVKVQMMPYKIPSVYSLEIEETAICQMREKLEIIKQSMLISDVESISLDWKQIGDDINNVFNRYRECLTEENKR